MGHRCRAASGKRWSVNRGRRAWWLAAGLAQLCLLPLGNDAWAEYRGRQFTIDRPKLGADVSYRFDSETRTGPSLNATNEAHYLNERLDLETAGWLYHPTMATYTLHLLPEWQQTMDKSDQSQGNTSNSFLLGYGFDLTLLPYKPYTVSLFANKQRSTLTSSLATQSESESDSYGATLRLKYKVLPSSLAYSHNSTTQTGFYDAQETRDDVRLIMRHNRKSNDTDLNASYTIQDRITEGSAIHTENLFGNLLNNYRITPDSRKSLNSSLSYRWSNSGLYTASGFSLAENLSWRHRKKLSSNYTFNYSQDTAQGTSIDQMSVGAGLSHTLYENLTTAVGVGASRSSSGSSGYGGNLAFSYQRRIPWGMIYASMGQDYRVTNRSVGGVPLQAPTEFLFLTTDGFTLLGNRNVDLATIRVTSSDLITTYQLNVDYTIEVIGTSVRIRRALLGAITEGQSVAVTYAYLSNPAFNDATYGQSYGLGFYLWSAWRIDYRYSHSQQDFLSGVRPDVLNEDTRQTLDSDLTWKWSTTRFYYEDTTSSAGISVQRWRLEESLRFRPSYTTSLGASATYGQTTLKETGDQDKFYSFRADLQRLISGTSKIRLEALYNVSEGTTLSTLDKGAAAVWEWSYGIWRADATYRFLEQEDLQSGQSRKRNSVFVTLRRALY